MEGIDYREIIKLDETIKQLLSEGKPAEEEKTLLIHKQERCLAYEQDISAIAIGTMNDMLNNAGDNINTLKKKINAYKLVFIFNIVVMAILFYMALNLSQLLKVASGSIL